MDEPYSKRELDIYFEEIKKILGSHDDVHKEILEQVKFTNGKVKRLYLILTALGAYVLGMSQIGLPTLLKLIL